MIQRLGTLRLVIVSVLINASLKLPSLNIKHFFLVILLLCVAACQSVESNVSSSSQQEDRTSTQLVLNNAILEQSNDRDRTVWKIKAEKIVYTEDKKKATLETVTGNLLQEGKVVLKISAESGEVLDNGNLILLKDKIVATAPHNGMVVRTDAMEWQPTKNVLIAAKNLSATQEKMEVVAQKGKYYTDRQSLELENKVTATVFDPSLQLTSDRLIWSIPENLATSPNNLQIVRYQADETISDRLVADRGQVNLQNKIATLTNNIEVISFAPQLQIATNSLSWNYDKRIGKTEQPIQIIARDRQLDITGNQGEVDFQKQIARLSSGIKAINTKNAAQLYASELVWYLNKETMEATGNIAYQQKNPQVNLTGEKAVGNLQTKNIIVTGGEKKKPVTSIIGEP
jgi:LPS export ABC transporter protein LptC